MIPRRPKQAALVEATVPQPIRRRSEIPIGDSDVDIGGSGTGVRRQSRDRHAVADGRGGDGRQFAEIEPPEPGPPRGRGPDHADEAGAEHDHNRRGTRQPGDHDATIHAPTNPNRRTTARPVTSDRRRSHAPEAFDHHIPPRRRRAGAVDDEHPVGQRRHRHGGDVVGDDVPATAHHRVRLGQSDQRHAASCRRAETDPLMFPGRLEQLDHVPGDGLRHVSPPTVPRHAMTVSSEATLVMSWSSLRPRRPVSTSTSSSNPARPGVTTAGTGRGPPHRAGRCRRARSGSGWRRA